MGKSTISMAIFNSKLSLDELNPATRCRRFSQALPRRAHVLRLRPVAEQGTGELVLQPRDTKKRWDTRPGELT